MFTPSNYFEKIKGIDFDSMPDAIREGHALIVDFTKNGDDWEDYYESDSIKEMVDIYFTSLQKHFTGNTVKPDANNSSIKPSKATAAEKKQPVPKKVTSVKKTKSSRKVKTEKNDSNSPVPENIDVDKLRINHYRDVKKMSSEELDNESDEIRLIEEEGEELDEDEKVYKVQLLREFNLRLPKTDPNKLYSQDIPPETNYEEWRIEFRDLKKLSFKELDNEIQKVINVENYNGLTPKEEEYRNTLFSERNKKAPKSLVERMPEEIRFIRRFLNLHGKVKDKDDLLRLINPLQKAILEKRIRKTSPYAEQIKYIQNSLIEMYNSMKGKIKMKIKEDVYETMKTIVGSEKVLPSINFIKRYIGMNGKAGIKQKAKLLLTQVDKAYEKGMINSQDPYALEMEAIKKNLREFLADTRVKTLYIETNQLRGLNGILGCACQSLNGPEELPQVMNSMDFANMQFKTLGLKGKWRDLIGDPSNNFTAMIFGKPKMGKSYLAVDFAGYLARNHGKVLYAAREEGLDKTLQDKLNDKNVKHPNLDVASILPEDLAPYDFIFLDSVSRLGLTADDLRRLKALHPTKSFIYIFQSTKTGNFKGENSFQHDVDVVIEVPEKGKATQMGRFNQGGEMNIFNTQQAA